MLWLTLVACSPTPPPEPAPLPAPPPEPAAPAVQVVPEPVAPAEPPPPRPAERAPITGTFAMIPGAELPSDCRAPCGTLRMRVEASSELSSGSSVHVADLAVDGDDTTSWCGVGGVGEQFSLALPAAVDLRWLALRMPSGRAGWSRATLVTDRRDRLEIEVPAGRDAQVRVDLPGVQFVQIEAVELRGEGPACLAEVALAGGG